MKPSIRKSNGVWVLTRTPFGFASEPATTVHSSWKAACRALLGSAPATAPSWTALGQHTIRTVNQRGTVRHGTIRMEDTA